MANLILDYARQQEEEYGTPNPEIKAVYMPSFEEFYNLYGKKLGGKKARAAWNKLSFIEHNLIMNQLPERLLTDIKWLAGYQPHPTTYLNGALWEDEYETSRRDSKGSRSIESTIDRLQRT